MRKILLAAALCATLCLPSCKFISINKEAIDTAFTGERIVASDNYTTEKYEIEAFSKLNTSIPCDIVYTDGPATLSIEAPDNIIEHIVILQENGELKLKTDVNRFRNLKKMCITISTPEINEIELNGAADFKAPEGIVTDSIKLNVNGAGDININSLKASRNVRIGINGAGDANLSGLECENLYVVVNGAGDCTISGHANENASIQVNGAGDINIHDLTSPNTDTAVHGAGKVRR